MHIRDLISPDRIRYSKGTGSKKRALEQLSHLLAEGNAGLTQEEVFDSLLGRERLGSTGFGKGVAIPHSRISGLTEPTAAFVRLDRGVDFDSMDNQPVDLLFALLVPDNCSEEHLQLLAQLAQMISVPDLCSKLRNTDKQEELYKLLQQWDPENLPA